VSNERRTGMSEYFLEVFMDKDWKKKLERFEFDFREEFIAWPDNTESGVPFNDQVSSFRYCLPTGWKVQLHKDRNANSKHKSWEGTGSIQKVNQDQIGWNDTLSAHKWVKL